jgi:hypothetical protein
MNRPDFVNLLGPGQISKLYDLVQLRADRNQQLISATVLWESFPAVPAVSIEIVNRKLQAAIADVDFSSVSLSVVAHVVQFHLTQFSSPTAAHANSGTCAENFEFDASFESAAVSSSSNVRVDAIVENSTLPAAGQLAVEKSNFFLFNSVFPPSTSMLNSNLFKSPPDESQTACVKLSTAPPVDSSFGIKSSTSLIDDAALRSPISESTSLATLEPSGIFKQIHSASSARHDFQSILFLFVFTPACIFIPCLLTLMFILSLCS